jgi:hypothetical protein
VRSRKTHLGFFAILAAQLPFAVGCNSILGIKSHSLAADSGITGTAGTGGAGGAAGVGGMAVGSGCSVDGSAMDADGIDAAVGMTCGFIMPNPLNAPGDLPNRASYRKNQAAKTVTDNITGLTWEAEVDATTVYTQAEAITHCQDKPGGSWRLPTRIELVSLVDFTVAKPGPTVSAAAFTNDPVWTDTPDVNGDYRKFWTSSHAAFDGGTGWEVDFSDGSTHQKPSGSFYKARCVTGSPCRCPLTRYQVTGSTAADEVVHDGFTGLTWQRAVADTKMVWSDAATYCTGGWRLPTPTELPTIVDETRETPSIDGVTFADTPGEPFWTSSPQAGSADGGPPAFAWYVTFYHGHSDVYPSNAPANYKWWVRCVRSGGP